ISFHCYAPTLYLHSFPTRRSSDLADIETVIGLAMPHLIKAGKLSEDMDEATKTWAEDVIGLYREQLRYGAEIVELTELFFKQSIDYDEAAMEVLHGEQVPEVLQVFTDKLIHLDEFNKDT